MRSGHRIRHAGELLYLLVQKELKVRYKNSVLGYVWALANPFAFAFIYWVAFKFIMRVQMENYSIYLITGMFPWIWMSGGVTGATRSFQVNASLVKKVRLPRAVLPLSSVTHEMVHFFFALPVILVFLWFAGGLPLRSSWLWQFPLMVGVQLSFVYPLALIFALANVYVHDFEYLIGIAFSLLFFATPMVYPISMVPEAYRPYFELSPLNSLIQSWRSVFLEGRMEFASFFYTLAFAALFGLLAWWLYRKLASRIGELL